MKTIIIALSLALAASLSAREEHFEWDAATHPTDGFSVEIREPGGDWVQHAVTAETEFKGEFPDGPYEISLRYIYHLPNENGPSGAGVIYSERGFVTPFPDQRLRPKGMRIRLTIGIEHSEDLGSFKELLTVSYPASEKEFFRALAR